MKVKKPIVVGVGIAALLAMIVLFFATGWPLIQAAITQDDRQLCSANKFEIESRSARVESRRLIVTALVRNNNPIPCGARVNLAVKDETGKVVANEPLWAAGVDNIPAGGAYSFPIYLSPALSEQAQSGSYDIKTIEARVWKQQ